MRNLQQIAVLVEPEAMHLINFLILFFIIRRIIKKERILYETVYKYQMGTLYVGEK